MQMTCDISSVLGQSDPQHNRRVKRSCILECVHLFLSPYILIPELFGVLYATISRFFLILLKVIKASQVISFTASQAVVTSFFFSQEALYNFFISMPVESVAITDTPIIHMTCPKSQSPIRQLDFSNCAMSDTIFSSVVDDKFVECQNLRNLKNLTLVGNSLKKLEILSQRFQYMSSLQHLDLSVNSIGYDQPSPCIWPASITNINLSSNSLTESVFQCLPNGTQILDLQNNQISVVPQSIFKLRNLSTLNLNANRLRDLPACDTFPTLHKLLLRSNSLHAPSVNILERCPKLHILDVSFNPFTCICTLRGFIKLAINSEKSNSQSGIELLNWPQGYYCTYPEDVRNSTLRDISIPEVSCSIGLLVVAILVPAGTLIISVVILCHFRFPPTPDPQWRCHLTTSGDGKCPCYNCSPQCTG
uniref:Uncharacterized protein n=1 Tax=Neolamprologus brichardi TaxID=32507 RepID=A0A3Q4GYE1_NEOBR